MRIPQKPPTFEAKEVIRALTGYASNGPPLEDEEYLHWDDLRHRPPPEGIARKTWWILLKSRRRSFRKELPLKDREGKPFTLSLPDPVPELLHRIDQNASGSIQLPEQVLDPATRDGYVARSLIEESLRSSQIEGAVTTRKAAKELIRSGKKPRNEAEQMVVNTFETMERIRRIRGEALSPSLVLDLHRMMTRDTLRDLADCGRLRTTDDIHVLDTEGQVIHVPPPAEELPARLEAMCAFANGATPKGFVHPALRAIVLHFWLAYDHPFVDGNGRCARALFYWAMLHSGYWLFEFLSISHAIRAARQQYYRAFLHTETDENDLTYFVLYHLDVIEKAIADLNSYLRRRARELRELQVKLRGFVDLNHRQKDLLRHALRNPGYVYTIEGHRRSHGVVTQTARTDLLGLAEAGLLTRGKSGRSLVFSPVRDLERVLARSGRAALSAPAPSQPQ